MENQKLHVQHTYNISTFKKLKLNYWGIRKCANTTMKYILLRAENPKIVEQIEKRDKNNVNAHGNPHRGWVHNRCVYITPVQAKENGFKNFTVLRDPIQRVCSMYNNCLQRPDRAVASGSDQFKDDMKVFLQNPTIMGFLDVLEKYPDEERNIHYRSQKSHCLIENIIKLKLDTLALTIHSIHPSLNVDIKLNASEEDIKIEPLIKERIYQIFNEDHRLYCNSI